MLSFLLFLVALVLSLPRNDAFYVTRAPSLRQPQRLLSVVTTKNKNNNNYNIPKDYGQQQTLFAVMDNSYDNNNVGDNDDGGRDDEDGSIDYERYKAALEHNVRRTDVRIFLTQRAIQSFINLLITCRDPHTVRWLEVR